MDGWSRIKGGGRMGLHVISQNKLCEIKSRG